MTQQIVDKIHSVNKEPLNMLRHLTPVEQVVACGEAHEAFLAVTAEIAAIRRAAVRELRQTYTLKDISEMTGVSISRVSQMELGYGRREKMTREQQRRRIK